MSFFVREYCAHQNASFMPLLSVLCVQGTPCTGSVHMYVCVIRYCTCTLMILAKVVLRAQHSADVGALHKRYCFRQSSTEGIF
jgi:hypothetical protein